MKMSVSSVHWAGGFTGDGQTFAASIEDAIEAIQLASRMEASCLVIHPGARNGHTTKHDLRLFDSALNRLVPIASDYGVKLVLEPIPAKQKSPWTFIENFEETLAILDRYSSRHLGLVLDLHHVGFLPNVIERLDQFVDRIELVQLADRDLADQNAHRLPLGQGQLPFVAWLSRLQQLGYAGLFELEVHGRAMDGIDYYSMLNATREFFAAKKINRLIDVLPRTIDIPARYQLNREN